MAKTKYKNLRKQLIKWAKATSRILLVDMLQEKIKPKKEVKNRLNKIKE